MAIKTQQEIMDALHAVIGEENVSDEALALFDDVADTLGATGDSAQRISALEQQLADNDRTWRARYRDRFLNGPTNEDEDIGGEDPAPQKLHFEDLFN